MNAETRVREFHQRLQQLKTEIGKVMVGQSEVVDAVLVCLFSGGHCLLEGVPGLGKTHLVKSLAQVLAVKFSRIQFTPDLMPADIVGTNIVASDEEGRRAFRFERGPIFANIVLADEINRATPKTQSAMLEAMQEHRVSVGGQSYTLQEPFLVLATQNPLEMEGTYPLPEAQLDRFFYKVIVAFPSRSELAAILERTTEKDTAHLEPVITGNEVLAYQALVREVSIAPHVRDYAVRLVLATHPNSDWATDLVKRYVRYGSSPRGAQALVLAGKFYALSDARYNVSFADIERAVLPALRHRIIVNFEGEAEGVRADEVLRDVLRATSKHLETSTS